MKIHKDCFEINRMVDDDVSNVSFGAYRLAAEYIRNRLKDVGQKMPEVGIICGSGLSGLSKTLSGDTCTISYGDIPGFPDVSVVGHAGELVVGNLAETPTICFRGRFHSYEGHDMNTVALPVRVMRCLGVKLLLVTNAAGGLNDTYNVGDIVCIMDHFALPMLAGKNPLIGHNDSALGPRFPPTSNMYDTSLQDVVLETASQLSFEEFVRKDGTYCFVSGPMYESRAECRFLRSIGGDTVGMSTVPELLAAHHSGMKVLCLSLVTNKVVIEENEGPPASHEEVIAAVDQRSQQLQSLVLQIVQKLQTSQYLSKLPNLPSISPLTKLPKKSKITMCPYHLVVDNISFTNILLAAAIASIGALLNQRPNR